jgi:hypothetical protein
MNKKFALSLCLAALTFVAARSTTAPVWDTCPGPVAYRGGIIVTACVHKAVECPKVYDAPKTLNVDIQCWTWFPGDDGMAPHWQLQP